MSMRSRGAASYWITSILLLSYLQFGVGAVPIQQPVETVRAIPAPATPLPAEDQSAGVTRFSFIAYGDTRSTVDGTALQPVHSQLVDSMIRSIRNLQNSDYPVRFVLQSGDAVVNGRIAGQLNTSFIDVVSRLTQEGNVPYYFIPGNHDVTTALSVGVPARDEGLKNYLDMMARLIPPDGSPRRLAGYPTFAFGYGNTFVIGLDSNISPDETQFNWVKNQLEGLNRNRFVNVIVFLHHAPFTSGGHRIAELATEGIRIRYMPLFRTHHVAAIFGGHDHEFEHYVEHYTDNTGVHRMDLIVSAGGGAPLYAYTGEPDTADYLAAGASAKVQLEHIVKPFPVATDNKFHFTILRVDANKLSIEVVGLDPAAPFKPYGKDVYDLRD
jgi:calcineurin-like phosphoesterase family protein